MTQITKLNILQAIFVGVIMLANLAGLKVVSFGPIQTSVGIWLIPISFLITDILAEVKGKKYVQSLIYGTVIAMLISFLYLKMALAWPPAARFEYEQEFQTIFAVSSRFFIASLIAFLISQIHDVWAFEFWKRKTKGKMLWLRNNLSTMVSQFIDSTIFIFIAFYGISERFDFAFMWHLIVPLYIMKVLLAALDTPFVYLGVKWLKNSKE